MGLKIDRIVNMIIQIMENENQQRHILMELGMTDEILDSMDGDADDLVSLALQMSFTQSNLCALLLSEFDDDDDDEEKEEEEEEEDEEEEDGNSSISTITNETATRNIEIDIDAEKNIGRESERVEKKRKGVQTNQMNDTKEYKKIKR